MPGDGRRMSDAAAGKRAPPVGLSTAACVLAGLMYTMDTTIANVALPHIQGSVSAGPEQIGWVLTSYLIASAIATPLSGWFSNQIGRKRLFMTCIVGFVAASMLCGVAATLGQLVVFRLLQGLFGASIVPISQAVLLDTYPPGQQGRAMAMWSMGGIMGPILGPALGGFLTEHYSWRWCFYVNLPVGILAFIGAWLFIARDGPRSSKTFDFLGFGMLSLFIGGFQLMMDRGPGEDWFGSQEIWIEAIVSAIGFWIFLAHTLTTDRPFFDRAFLRDRNFFTATLFGFFFGIMLFASMAVVPPMTQNVLGYPVLTAGLLAMPRGVGSFFSMYTVGRLVGRVDNRLLLMAGLSITCLALWQMTRFDLSMGPTPLVVSGIFQGFGMGMLFVPLSTAAFATIAPALRNEGAAVFGLVRSLGASVGVSIMQGQIVRNTEVMHASLAARVIPSDPVVRSALAGLFNLDTEAGRAALNAEINRQSTMVAYVDVFKLMLIMTIACVPLIFFMHRPRRAKGAAGAIIAE
jgi:DHA2 family multidrug resistance protein